MQDICILKPKKLKWKNKRLNVYLHFGLEMQQQAYFYNTHTHILSNCVCEREGDYLLPKFTNTNILPSVVTTATKCKLLRKVLMR